MQYMCSRIIQSRAHVTLCRTHRKSRIVGTVEEVHKAVDDWCADRLNAIVAAKERHMVTLKQKASYVLRTHP